MRIKDGGFKIEDRRSRSSILYRLGARAAGAPVGRNRYLGQALRLVGFGAVLGTVGGAAISRLLTSLLFGVSSLDPIAYVSVAPFLATVALLAISLPAKRAESVDPIVALRHE